MSFYRRMVVYPDYWLFYSVKEFLAEIEGMRGKPASKQTKMDHLTGRAFALFELLRETDPEPEEPDDSDDATTD